MITRLECDHFEIYRNIKSLCCIPGTVSQLYFNNNNKKKKQENLWEKRLDVCLPEAEGRERRNWTKVVKSTKFQL